MKKLVSEFGLKTVLFAMFWFTFAVIHEAVTKRRYLLSNSRTRRNRRLSRVLDISNA